MKKKINCLIESVNHIWTDIMFIKKEIIEIKEKKDKINNFYIKLSQWDVLESEQAVLMDIIKGYAEFFKPDDY